MNALEKLTIIANMKRLPRRLFQKLNREGAFKIICGRFIDAHPKVKRTFYCGNPDMYVIDVGFRGCSMKLFVDGSMRSYKHNIMDVIQNIDVFNGLYNMFAIDVLNVFTKNIDRYSKVYHYRNSEYLNRVQGFVWFVGNSMIFEFFWNFKKRKYEITDYYFVCGEPTESLNTSYLKMIKKIEDGECERESGDA